MKNTEQNYGLVAKVFHWVMAILIIGMVGAAWTMINIGPSPLKGALFGLHKATGLTIFTLAGLRLVWRLLNPVPVMPETVPHWQERAARLNHYLLYVLMFAMPITGFLLSTLNGHDVSYYGLFVIPAFTAHHTPLGAFFGQAHVYMSYLMVASLAGHISVALYHHYWVKDNLLRRIITE